MPDLAELLPPQAPPDQPADVPVQEIVLSREQMLVELLAWCNKFIDASAEWRRNSWETQWARWQRASDAIYDPALEKKKEKWQSKAVWPISAAHRENAQAQLFKTEIGPRPPIEFKARVDLMPPMPAPMQAPGTDQASQPMMAPKPVDQGVLIRDLVLREREKARYEIERNKVVEDKTAYGSGFMRAYFETVMDDRLVNEPIYETMSLMDPGSIMRAMSGQQHVVGYNKVVKSVPVYRGVRLEHISIWDVFKDPKALKIQGSGAPIAVRYNTTYGEIVKGAKPTIDPQTGEDIPGYYLPEAAVKLKSVKSDEETPLDKKEVESDRKLQDTPVDRPEYGKNLLCYEIEARLPKKWVLIDGQDIDDQEKLMPAVVRFHKSTVISVRPSDAYDGEPQIYQDDYIPVAGQPYGRGIPEMLKDVQLVSTETINQRLDAGSISIAQRFAVIEKALVDTKDIDENRNVIRLKAPGNIALTDVKQVIGRIDMGDVARTAFIEPLEWERIAQERTSITRATLGTSGQVKDANQTLGGQEMLKAATGDKLAFIGMLSEFGFQRDLNLKIFALIYQNYEMDDYIEALGPEKAAQLVMMTPEDVATKFVYTPKGIFEMENKALRQARIADMTSRYGSLPWFNVVGAAKAEIAAVDEEESTFILPEAEAMQIMVKAQEIGAGLAQQAIAQNEQKQGGGKQQGAAK